MTVRRWFCGLLLLAVAARAESPPPTPGPVTVSPEQVERLLRFGDAWGAARHFHPDLAGRGAEWDAAGREALARGLAAGTDAELAAAVAGLFATLNDPGSYVAQSSLRPPFGPFSLRWGTTSEGVLGVEITPADPDLDRRLPELLTALRRAKSVVFDLRTGGKQGPGLDAFLEDSGLVAALVPRTLQSPSRRHRIHLGWSNETDRPSGPYSEGWWTWEGPRYRPREAGNRERPVVFLTGPGSQLPDLALALREAGLAALVSAGPLDPGWLTGPLEIPLGGGWVATVRQQELTLAGFPRRLADVELRPTGLGRRPRPGSGPVDFDLDAAVSLASAFALPGPTPRDRPFFSPPASRDEAAYPDAAGRVFAGLKLASVMEQFFPYLQLADRPWRETLRAGLPRLAAAGDATAYHVALAELAAELDDSHVRAESDVLARYRGEVGTALLVQAVEGRWLVTRVVETQGAGGAQVGDEVLTVDGEAVTQRADRLGRTLGASTPQALRRQVASRLLNGPEGTPAALTLRDAAGRERTAQVARAATFGLAAEGGPRGERDGEVVRELTPTTLYVDLDRLEGAGVDAVRAQLVGKENLVLDLRGYPRGTAWSLTPWLDRRATPPVAARFARPLVIGPAPWVEPQALRFDQPVPPRPAGATPWAGRIVVLIDERAVSQSEHTALFLRAAAEVTFVGSPTDGTNGDVTYLSLPGGIAVRFTGQSVTWPDGRRLQRVGILPDVPVTPTLAGVRAGRDEVLEAALAWLGNLRGGG